MSICILIDLPGYHLRLLQEAGIRAKNIVSSRYCTSCHHQHFFPTAQPAA
ncbi:MAG: laccase domain-containing protein [Dethiobacter sp.]